MSMVPHLDLAHNRSLSLKTDAEIVHVRWIKDERVRDIVSRVIPDRSRFLEWGKSNAA